MKSKRKSMWKNSWSNEHGFTLVEVMAAFVILLLASQLLFVGSASARRLEKRANELSAAADRLYENLADESKCISGSLRLNVDEETELTGDGWLYQEDLGGQTKVWAIRVDEGK